MCCTPCLVGNNEMIAVIAQQIDIFLNNLANAESIDEKSAMREYFVWVSILQRIDAKRALDYPTFEEALQDKKNNFKF